MSGKQMALRRPASESLSEIALGSLLFVWVFGTIAYISHIAGVFEPLLIWSVAAGQVALAHIGWGFGVAVPTMLGFYVIVTGGQLLDSQNESATRRLLGGISLLVLILFAPALLLIGVACLHDPTLAGALLVVLPSYGVMLFLAIQLGGFVIDPEARRAAALATREWARERVKALSKRSRQSITWVVVVNIAVATILGGAVTLAMIGVDAAPLTLVHLIVAVALTLAAFGAARLAHLSRDRLGVVLVWVVLGLLYFTVLGLILQLWLASSQLRGVAAGLLVVEALLLSSTFWPRSRRARFVLDWSIQGAATRGAVRAATKRLVKSVAEIAALKPAVEARPSILAGLRRVLGKRISR